jgi:hypothetical protein
LTIGSKMRFWYLNKALAVPFMICIFLLNAIHPFVHGTFLDGGSLDVLLQQLNLMTIFILDRGN